MTTLTSYGTVEPARQAQIKRSMWQARAVTHDFVSRIAVALQQAGIVQSAIGLTAADALMAEDVVGAILVEQNDEWAVQRARSDAGNNRANERRSTVRLTAVAAWHYRP